MWKLLGGVGCGIGGAKTDRAARQAIREQVVGAAKKLLRPDKRGKFLLPAARTITPAQLRRATIDLL